MKELWTIEEKMETWPYGCLLLVSMRKEENAIISTYYCHAFSSQKKKACLLNAESCVRREDGGGKYANCYARRNLCGISAPIGKEEEEEERLY